MKKLVIAFLIFGSQVCFAQQDTILLKEVEIKAPKITPSEVYKKVVFDSTKLANSFANNLAELLEQKSSSYIKNAGAGQLATLSFRGTSSQHTQLYWNGISVNAPTLGLADLSIVPMAFINEAEIHYGASGIVDGSGSIGGSIQLSQIANWKNKTHISYKTELASFSKNTQSLSIEFGNKKVQSQTNLFYQTADNNYTFVDVSKTGNPFGKLENADYKNAGFTQNIFYKLNLKNRINLKSYYYKNNRNLPPLIGSINKNERQTDEHLRTMLEWQNFANKYKQELKLAYLKDNQNYTNEQASIESQILVNKLSALYQYTRNLGSKTKFESNFLNEWSQVKSDGIATKKEQTVNSLLVSLEHKFSNRLFANFVGRQELLDFELVPFSPSIGVKYKINPNKNYFVKANISRTYRAPNLNHKYWIGLGNPDLLPEQGWASEVSVVAETKKKSNVSATLFQNKIDNWIQWLPNSSGQFVPQNLDAVLSQGFEFDFDKKVKIKKLEIQFNGGYSYTGVKNTKATSLNDNSVDKQLIYVPFHKLQASVNLVYKGYKLNYNQSYTSETYVQKDHSSYLPYFAPANMSFSKNIKLNSGSKIAVQLKANNLFNEDYHVVANRPMPRRNYALSLVYDFNK